jgi:protein-disulfide isomerase
VSALDRRLFLAAGAGLLLAPLIPAHAAVALGDMSLGRPTAKVKIVEYASASCTHCAHFHTEVFEAFKKKYVDTGKVHYTLREVLTDPAEVAAAGFLIARCKGASGYFPALQVVFRNQRDLFEPGGVFRVGEKAGLAKAQVEACVSDEAWLAAANASTDRAIAADVQATPTFFVNGNKAHEGFWSLAEMSAVIDAAL